MHNTREVGICIWYKELFFQWFFPFFYKVVFVLNFEELYWTTSLYDHILRYWGAFGLVLAFNFIILRFSRVFLL